MNESVYGRNGRIHSVPPFEIAALQLWSKYTKNRCERNHYLIKLQVLLKKKGSEKFFKDTYQRCKIIYIPELHTIQIFVAYLLLQSTTQWLLPKSNMKQQLIILKCCFAHEKIQLYLIFPLKPFSTARLNKLYFVMNKLFWVVSYSSSLPL